MRLAYFQCFAGISGDMILGSLVDAGLDIKQLEADLAGLAMAGYRLTSETVIKKGVKATRVRVITSEGQEKNRHLKDIKRIIINSALPQAVKEKSIEIFIKLAAAEAEIHHTTPERIHFHEVGALDAIVDIVGSVAGLRRLGVKDVWASPVNTGEGFVKCAHGTLPVPAPATLELLKGVPIYSSGIQHELATPTGAAILTAHCRQFSSLPTMKVDLVGYGAGDLDLPIPNVLRVLIGERMEQTVPLGETSPSLKPIRQEEALLMETNIDDMNPEYYDYLMGSFLKAGAMDVFLKPIQMKKNRPAVTLSVLIRPDQLSDFYKQIFAETTSLGVRVSPVTKYMLSCEITEFDTSWGPVRVKIGWEGEEIRNIAPEYEDCRKIAAERNIPLKHVYDTIKHEFWRQMKEPRQDTRRGGDAEAGGDHITPAEKEKE